MSLLATFLLSGIPQVTPLPFWVRDISGDGKTVIGTTHFVKDKKRVGVTWTKAGGIRNLLCPPDSKEVEPTGVSDDGKVVVGFAWRHEDYEVLVWRNGGKPTVIGITQGIDHAPIVSKDGTCVYFTKEVYGGIGDDYHYSSRTARWREGQALKLSDNYVMAISRDGKLQVGLVRHPELVPKRTGSGTGIRQIDNKGTVATRWEDGKAPLTLGIIEPAWATLASACSADGKVIGGWASTEQGDRPFLWSQERSLRFLRVPDSAKSVEIYHISGDGHFVFGQQQAGSSPIPLLWIDEVGPISIIDEARRRGLPKESLWLPEAVMGTSNDGRYLIGYSDSDKQSGDQPSCWLLNW